jgi:hypothetical protein
LSKKKRRVLDVRDKVLGGFLDHARDVVSKEDVELRRRSLDELVERWVERWKEVKRGPESRELESRSTTVR